jgi:hypothetical protein
MAVSYRTLLAFVAFGALAACSQKDQGLNTIDDSGGAGEACTAPTLSGVSEDQSVTLGAMVALAADGSICIAGEPSFTWAVESAPVESGIDSGDLDLTNPKQPTFVPDVVGTYVLSVFVSDSDGTRSAVEYVVVDVASGNSAPVADCGANRTAGEGDRVQLDGSASRDPEGARLTYNWTLASAPDCSALVPGSEDVFEHTTAAPSVIPDCGGVFVMGLTVSDGEQWSAVDYCSVTVAADNRPPIADAGNTGLLSPCTAQTYQLNGYGSYDPEGEALTYRWTLLTAPAGSAASDASFDDTTLPNPIFSWDLVGSYTFQLQVYDGNEWSVPDVVTHTFQDASDNYIPIANAGDDVSVSIETDCSTSSYTWTCPACDPEEIDLDASASIDPVDGDELSFQWSEPTSSLTIASRFSAITTATTPTIASTYNTTTSRSWTIDLTVSDCADSDTDSLTVTYSCRGTYTP